MSLACVTDLRQQKKWSAADLARKAALWIVGDYWGERPPVEGRVLAYVNPAILLKDGRPYSEPDSFNSSLESLPRLDMKPLWTGAGGEILVPLDITRRGVVGRFVAEVAEHISWADGVNVCYFTSLDWVDPGKYSVEFWEKWDNALGNMGNALRGIEPGWLCLAQQFHLTTPTMQTNGLYLEGNGPYDFRYSPAKHADELQRMQNMLEWADSKRECLWVQEIRQPGLYSTSDLTAILSWAHDLGIYTSVGRDATARGDV